MYASTPETENQYGQLLELITEFYCTLSIKKDMQNISCQIREFVILRDGIKKKQETARRILDFFLRLESELVYKYGKNWDQAFQILTAQGQALLRMCDFPAKHSLSLAFNRLKNNQTQPTVEDTTIMLKMCKNDQEVHIQVEKEIKTMTYYFFKWCQYAQYSRTLRELKKKSIENEKISQSFNKYGAKSNCFNGWKILYKKAKLERERAKQIQSKIRQNLLRKCVYSIQEMAAIIGVEADLSRKVGQKLNQIRKKQFYRKLKINQRIISFRVQKRPKIKNPITALFLEHLTYRLKPLMNKSFVLSRAKIAEQEKSSMEAKYFLRIKKLYLETQQKSKILFKNKKIRFFKWWQDNFISDAGFADQCQKLEGFLLYRRRRVAVALLSINKLLRREQFKKIQIFMQTLPNLSLTAQNLMEVNRKKQIQDRKNEVQAIKLQKNSLKFIKELVRSKEISQYKASVSSKIKWLLARTITGRYKNLQIKLAERRNFYASLQHRKQQQICIFVFAKWKRMKHYHKIQEASLSFIDNYSKRLVMKSFWNKFVYRASQKSCIQKLISASESALVRISFVRLASKTLKINQSVQRMKQSKNAKLVKNLFTLLVKNQRFNGILAQGIQKCFVKRCQKVMMKRLKQLHAKRKQRNNLKILVQKARSAKFLSILQEKQKNQKQITAKGERVSKMAFLFYFKKSIRRSFALEESMEIKYNRLKSRLREIEVKQGLSQLKTMRKIEKLIQQKKQKLIFKLCRIQILKLKQHIQALKRRKQLKRGSQKLQENRIQGAFKILLLKQKSRTLATNLSDNKKSQSFIDFCSLIKIQSKLYSGVESIKMLKSNKQRNQFIQNLKANKKQIDEKVYKIELSLQKNIQNQGLTFLTLLKSNKQNITNNQKLLKSRKQAYLSQFIALSLKTKFDQIKFHCSLKAYARNIMKKAFKSLKLTRMKLKQKQNNIRLDRTSSIMIEKSIEKSFKSNSLSEQIQKFNLRKSRQIR